MSPTHDRRASVCTITPSEAASLLARNTNNRKLRLPTVEKYARDMREGRWRLTYDPVRIGLDGALFDGQHRLTACVESGCSFETLVVWGLVPEDFTVLDTGASRSLSDVLRWRGEICVSELAATISWCLKYEAKAERDPRFQLSHQEKLLWLDNNPEVRRSVSLASPTFGRCRIPRTVLAGVHFKFAQIDEQDAAAFYARLKEPAGLDISDPIYALRRWVDGQAGKRDKPSSVVYSAFLIKAINHWREGRQVDVLFWRQGGATAEPFPRLERGDQ